MEKEVGEGSLAVMRGIKYALDPFWLMNPGKIFDPWLFLVQSSSVDLVYFASADLDLLSRENYLFSHIRSFLDSDVHFALTCQRNYIIE